MALFTTAVLMMAAASDVSMATGSGNGASNRQVSEADGPVVLFFIKLG